jgi:DNA replication and repair protein RecF
MAPIMLLDEIAAHLDPARRAALFTRVDAVGGQAFMTGTDRALFDALDDRAQYFRVENGTLTKDAERI